MAQKVNDVTKVTCPASGKVETATGVMRHLPSQATWTGQGTLRHTVELCQAVPGMALRQDTAEGAPESRFCSVLGFGEATYPGIRSGHSAPPQCPVTDNRPTRGERFQWQRAAPQPG